LGFIAIITFLVILSLAATFQPSWLPKPARSIALGVTALIVLIATVIPSLPGNKNIPAWAVYLVAGISGVFVVGMTLIRWLFFRLIDRSSQLHEALNACFQVLATSKELTVSDLKSRAEKKIKGGIRFNKWVWNKTLEALEQEAILKRVRPDGRI
jgi:hypothetical protein